VVDFISKGDRLLAEGDAVRAVLEYKNALQIDPKSSAAQFALGKAYLAQKEGQKAYGAFKAALELNPGLDEARLEVATIQVMGRQGQMALDELAQLKDPEKHRGRVERIRARALVVLDRHDEAIAILTALPDGDGDREVQMLLAQSFKTAGALDRMEQAVARWRAVDPADPGSYLFLAQVAAEHRDSVRTDEELKKMVAARPDDARLALLRAQVLEGFGLTKLAETAFEELPDTPENRKAGAAFWIRRGDRDKAAAILEKLIAADPGDVEAVSALTQVRVQQKDLDGALALLERTLAVELKKADRERVTLMKATLKAQQGDLEAAARLCNAVLADNQGNAEAHLLLGKVLINRRQTEEAEIHLNQAAVARPNDEEAQVLLARSQFLNKKEAMAEDTLKRAVDNNPNNMTLRMELVRFHFGKRQMDQVARVLDKGVELQPENIDLLRARGEFETSQKNYAKAGADFQKIISVRPELPLGHLLLGRLQMAEARWDDAVTTLRHAMQRGDGWQVAMPLLVQCHLAMGDKDAALGFLRLATEKHKDSPLAHFYLGQLLVALANYPEAEKSFQKAIQIAPDWPTAYSGMAELYVRQGKLKDAIVEFEKADKKVPSVPVRMQLAVLYEQDGRHGDAIRVYQGLLEQFAASAVLLNNLAYLYADYSNDPGELAKAAELAAKALEQDPENSNILDTAAWVAYRRGELDDAWSHIQKALLKAPEDGMHHLHAAVILHDRGDQALAREYLDKALQLKLDPRSLQKAQALKQEWGG
jgi:tetratricopeptide (TPR) repeat protein